MKFCPYCGAELVSEQAIFCMECGNKIPQNPKNEPVRSGERNAGREVAVKREGNAGREVAVKREGNVGREVTVKREENAGREMPVKRGENAGREVPVKKERKMRAEQSGQRRIRAGEKEDIMEMYASGQQERHVKQSQPKTPVPKKRRVRDDYDGYYDDVIPYDEGRIREENILEIIKKILIIIIAALVIVGVCVVLMYVL